MKSRIPFKIINALICEDVRQEINKKFLLIGVLGSKITIPAAGAVVFAVYLEVDPAEVGLFQVEFQIKDENNRVPVRGSLQLNVGELTPFALPFGPFPVQIISAGKITVQWKLPNQRTWEDVRSIIVDINPETTATASPPPPSQSPPDAPAS